MDSLGPGRAPAETTAADGLKAGRGPARVPEPLRRGWAQPEASR